MALAICAALPAAMTAPGCDAVPGAAGPADTFGLDFAGTNPSGQRGAVIFFIDGLNATIFQEMLEAGELPAIRRYFVDRGLYAPRAVAGTPSVTLASETSVVTGLFPGHHGITGINWFDRNRLISRNYETIAQKNTLDGDHIARMLYEYFPDRTTFSLFFQPHRGATKFAENWASAGPPFFFKAYEYVDRLALYRFQIVADVARKRREFPAATVVYNLAPDFRAYQRGVASPQYGEAIRHTDYQIGRVLGDMDRAGLLKDIYIALVSDHGLCEVQRHWPVRDFLRDEAGLEIASAELWESTQFEDRHAYYDRFPAVLYGSGDRYWAICLRKPTAGDAKPPGYHAWPVRPDAADLMSYPTSKGRGDLIAALVRQPAVDAVAYAAGPDRVRVRLRGGEVEFRQGGGAGRPITCRVMAGEDPLGWKALLPPDALAGAPFTPRQWLAMTAQSDYPDLPAQIVAYFRSPLAGDIAVFAAPEWDFGATHRAGHGGLRPGDMHVPLLLAGPGITPQRPAAARTVDLLPTLLHLLGRPVPPGLDGQVLVATGAAN